MDEVELSRIGRPRNADHDRAIVDAVFAELAERPYSRVSVDDVARRAGVAKTTLYRRYPSKLDLVRAAVEHYFATRFFTLQGHGVVDVIIDALEQQVHEFGATVAGKAIASLLSESLGNPDIHDLMRHDDKRADLAQALRRGIECGELRRDTDVDLVVDLLIAVFPYRLIVLQQPIPVDLAPRLARLLLDGCRAQGSGS